jgi:hypothetical protein
LPAARERLYRSIATTPENVTSLKLRRYTGLNAENANYCEEFIVARIAGIAVIRKLNLTTETQRHGDNNFAADERR